MNRVISRTNKNFVIFLKAIALLGVGFLIAAGFFYIQAIRDEALNLQPLALPVSLIPGTIKTPEFKADVDSWDYEIALVLESRVDRRQADCFFGDETNPDGCKGIRNPIDISWELFDGGKVAFQGNSRTSAGMTEVSTDLFERKIGTFRARRGHDYTIVLHVNRDASELNIAHPKIMVQIPRGYWEDHLMGISFGKLFAGISGLIGTMILVSAFAISRLTTG
jgi:hypothetical protein